MMQKHMAEDATALAESMSKMKIEEKQSKEAPPANKNALPTDAYREQILKQIERDRVTIIHGETG